MRDRGEFLAIANQKKRKEVWQCFVSRTMPYSEGVCMALAIAFIARNARNVPSMKKAARAQLGGMNDRQLAKIEALISALEGGETFTRATGNTFGAPPAELHDSSSANYTENIKKFLKEADDVPQNIQDRHLRVNALQNATSGRVSMLAGRGADEETAKIEGIKNQIWNWTGMDCQEAPPAGAALGESFWYISDGGHGWAAVARTREAKFKLYDPNYGIIWFDAPKHLSDAVTAYAGDSPRYLRFHAG